MNLAQLSVYIEKIKGSQAAITISIQDFINETYSLFLDSTSYQIILSAVDLFLEIGPYILITILIHVSFLRYFPLNKFSLSGKGKMITILIASLIGVLSPFPSYVAVPIGISLIAFGVPLQAVIAFAVASPLINPALFFLTFARLGAEIAFYRLFSAFLIGIAAGFSALFLAKYFTKFIKVNAKEITRRPLLEELYRSTLFFSKYFILAVLLSAIIKTTVTIELVEGLFAKNGPTTLLVAIAFGVPFYTCGGAAIPIIEVLKDMGMNNGAILAFFIAGPATKLETLFIYKSMMGLPVLIFYLLITLAGAFFFGILISLF